MKINLLNLDRKNMEKYFAKINEKPFRASQIMKWIYHNYSNNFDEMTNISKNLKNKLKQTSVIHPPKILKKYYSIDGTIKWILEIDKQQIESIYIPSKKRATLCISSQIGCYLNCDFCLTGKQGFNRNLYVSEIIGQIWTIKKKIKSSKRKLPKITNITIMGMGEPLLNLNNIITSINIMADKFGFSFSNKHITLSTAGIAPAIKKISSTNISLAVSLHATNNIIRNKIMPINKKYNIKTLLKSIKYFLKKSKNKNHITIEYIMLKNINDQKHHANKLIKILRGIKAKINLIPFNSFKESTYKSSSIEKINIFSNILKKSGIISTIRKSRGNDIYAACGQLSGNIKNKLKRQNS